MTLVLLTPVQWLALAGELEAKADRLDEIADSSPWDLAACLRVTADNQRRLSVRIRRSQAEA